MKKLKGYFYDYWTLLVAAVLVVVSAVLTLNRSMLIFEALTTYRSYLLIVLLMVIILRYMDRINLKDYLKVLILWWLLLMIVPGLGSEKAFFDPTQEVHLHQLFDVKDSAFSVFTISALHLLVIWTLIVVGEAGREIAREVKLKKTQRNM